MLTAFRAMASELLNRSALGEYAGLTFGGMRDLAHALGYKKTLTHKDYWLRYRRNSIAARVVEAFPAGTWRGEGAELIELENPDRTTTFERTWSELQKKHNIWPTFKKADILAGLEEYSVILIGAPGRLNDPLGTNLTPNDLYFMTAFPQSEAPIHLWEDDPTDERYGKPLLYKFKKLDSARRSHFVHWTRVIHVADNTLSDPLHGQPRLERVWNLLDDLEKVTGGGSEAFWLRAHQGYHLNLDKDHDLEPDEETKLSDEADEFVHGIRRVFRSRAMEMKVLGSDVAMFDRNVDAIISQVSAGTGIPKRILMGSERGQLASEQDRVNWAERVQDRRNDFAGPAVVRQTGDRFITHGFLPKPRKAPDAYRVHWPPIYDQSVDERSKIGARMAETNQKFGGIVITENEIREHAYGFPPIDTETITFNREKMKPKPVAPQAKSDIDRETVRSGDGDQE
jgi:hypothetical protein